MNNAIKNVIRTFVPAIIGTLGAYWAKVAGNLDTGQFASLVPLITTAYYAVIRWAEERYPALSWLLGAQPVTPAPVVAPKVVTITATTPPAA